MNSIPVVLSHQSRNFLPLTVTVLVCLILLINVSFKIVDFAGMWFTMSSILCPLVAGCYLYVFKVCSIKEQRRVLNQSLLALYVFSLGIYVLINLPSAKHLREYVAYQIIFEDIPHKFFSATVAFCLSFYLPHIYCSTRTRVLQSPKPCMLLALFGGLSFFTIDYWLLFSDPNGESLNRIYIDSLLICLSILLSLGVSYLLYLLHEKHRPKEPRQAPTYCFSPLYHYLISLSVVILTICLACEYRLIALTNGWTLATGGLLFPFIMLIGNLISELYGLRANLHMIAILVLAELVFDVLLMIIVVLPSPDFFNLNPFFSSVLPTRIVSTTLILFIALGSNACLLKKLKNTTYGRYLWGRLFIANLLANSLVSVVNYLFFFTGVFPDEQVFHFAFGAWLYKLIVTLIGLPLIAWLYRISSQRIKLNRK